MQGGDLHRVDEVIEPLARQRTAAAQSSDLPVGGVPRVAERQEDQTAIPIQMLRGANAISAMPVNVKRALTAVTWLGVRPRRYAMTARRRPTRLFTQME